MDSVRFIELPKIPDERGNLSFFQNNEQLPFSMKRVYWIYDVPGGEHRGGHAYRNMKEVIIALSGSFDVVLFDGKEEKKITLNRSYHGLYVPEMIWRSMENFSTNALAFVATDSFYDESEYIRDKEMFINEKHGAR
jgi:oxalate decarboxylase/phosphoglucose isomerase-like protein (cupin superfamily)